MADVSLRDKLTTTSRWLIYLHRFVLFLLLFITTGLVFITAKREHFEVLSKQIYGEDSLLMGSWLADLIVRPVSAILITFALLTLLYKERHIADCIKKIKINVLLFSVVSLALFTILKLLYPAT